MIGLAENHYLGKTRQIIVKIVPLKHPQKDSTDPATADRFILLGEDDIDDEEMLTEVFNSVDPSMRLLFINNGRRLVATIERLHNDQLPCLIILDYNMPERNGEEILRDLQRNPRYKSIPKLIWSTSGSEIYKQKCMELGASDYIIKPSNVGELKEAARYMLSFCSV